MKPHLRIASILFMALSANAAHAQSPQTIEVVMTSYAFTPDAWRLQRNMAYRIHLANMSSDGHSFDAPEFFAAVSVSPADQAKVTNGKVEVPAGAAVDVVVTPITAGTYRVSCSHFMHPLFGMHGEAVIQ